MAIHLPNRDTAFPRAHASLPAANAWGTQWRHLPRRAGLLVRKAIDGTLRRIG